MEKVRLKHLIFPPWHSSKGDFWFILYVFPVLRIIMLFSWRESEINMKGNIFSKKRILMIDNDIFFSFFSGQVCPHVMYHGPRFFSSSHFISSPIFFSPHLGSATFDAV
jgi:hypothetical protein